MSFVYSMTDTWNAIGTTFSSIQMNVTNGAAANPVGAAASQLLDLQTNATQRFGVRSPHFANGADATPFLNMVDIWNTSGAITGILYNVTNTASGATSLLMDLQVGGVSQFKVSKGGLGTFVGGVTPGGTLTMSTNAIVFNGSNLLSDAANTLALRNGATAQTFNLYNSFTDAANYTALSFFSDATSFSMRAKFSGSGSVRKILLGNDSQGNVWNFDTSGHLLWVTDSAYDIGASGATRPRIIYPGKAVAFSSITLASLSASVIGAASAGAGATAYISDGNAPTIFTTVAGSGTTPCPVYSDGTQWRAG